MTQDSAGNTEGHRQRLAELGHAEASFEDRYRRLAEQSSNAILVICQEKTSFANPTALNLFKVRSVQEFLAKDPIEFVHPDFKHTILERRRNVLEGEQIAPIIETVLLRFDRTEFPADTTAASITWEGRPAVQVIVRDLTDRKRAEGTLQRREKRLKEAERAARMGHWRLDATTGELARSDQDIRNYGIEPGEMEPTFEAFLERVHPDDRQMVKARADAALNNLEPGEYEFRTLWPNGEVRTICAKYEFELDQNGALIRMFGVNQDVTEQKRVEGEFKKARDELENRVQERTGELQAANKALQKSEELFRRIVENSPSAIFLKDLDGRFQLVNRRFEEWQAVSATEVVGKTAHDIYPKAFADEVVSRDRELFEKRETSNLEVEVPFADGNVHTAFVTKFPVVDADGRMVGIGGISTDITERKQAEQALRKSEARYRELNRELEQRVAQRTEELRVSDERAKAQFKHNPIPTFVWQRSGNDFVRVDHNDAADKLTNNRAEKFTGANERKLFKSWPEGRRLMHQCYAEKRTLKSLAQRSVRGDGVLQWIDSTFVFVPPDLVMVHAQNVTAEKVAELALREAKEAADQANAAKSRFLAAASHDLRQPLQALALFTALLEEQLHDDKDREIVAKMDTSVDVMTDLLNTLLDISKLEAGTIVPEITEVSVDELIRSIATFLSSSVLENDVTLRTVTSHAVVRTDPVLIERIVQNFAANAIHHSGGNRVLMGCRRRGDNLRIEVWDNGKGIPESEQKQIFEEFYQLDNPAMNRRKGLGLGLSIVDRLGRLLGHPIEISSSVGNGSVFSVELPLAKTDLSMPQPSRTRVRAAKSGILVAVIDDEPNVLDASRMILEALGYDVLAAMSEQEALTALASHGDSPQLVISDYRLRDGARGTDAINAIRNAVGEEIPGIIITGDTSPDKLTEAAKYGFRLLHKPVRSQVLAAEIAEILDAWRRRE